MRILGPVFITGLIGTTGTLGYYFVRTQLEADIYKQKFSDLASDYNTLRNSYNKAIGKTVVTELVVEGGRINVVIRNAAGEVERYRTPYTIDRRIYVDYIVYDQKLMIRSVFDSATTPDDAFIIDSNLIELDWSDHKLQRELIIAQGGLTDGRWQVKVNGTGSLYLDRSPDDAGEDDIMAQPPIHDYEKIQKEIEQEMGEITIGDVWDQLLPNE